MVKDIVIRQRTGQSKRYPPPRQIWSVVKAVREVLNVSHLELVEIKMRDRTTGREHKWGGDTSGSAQRGEREEKRIPEKIPCGRACGTRNSRRD